MENRNEGMMIKTVYFLFNIMIKILPIVGLLLSIPLIAMQLTDEVNWSFFDFINSNAFYNWSSNWNNN